MTYFWIARENVPDGIGFSLYSWQHLLWLAGITFGAICLVMIARHLAPQNFRRLLQGLAWGIVVLETLKLGILCGTGQFRPSYIPLELCGISIVLELFATYCHNPFLLECLYSLSLPGACLALLFPNWNKLPLWNYFCLNSFLLHGLLVWIPILLLANGELHPSWKRLPFCFWCIWLACIPISWINGKLGTNFFFLERASKGSPLVWFEETFGSHLIGLPVMMASIWLLLYGVPALIRGMRHLQKNKTRRF